MRNTAAFANFVTMPTIIDAPGYYLTRGGERVLITKCTGAHSFGCTGTYSNGTLEAWHKSGRLYFGMQTVNDIVAKA